MIMALSNTSRTKCLPSPRYSHLLVAMGALLLMGSIGLAEDLQSTHRYKMVSSVEYAGKGQFRNHVETLFTVKKQPLPDNKVQYSLSLDDRDPNVAVSSSSTTLSFILDRVQC